MRLDIEKLSGRARKRLEDPGLSERQTFRMARAYTLHKEKVRAFEAPLEEGDNMLDPWIIEEIKRREQRSRINEQPVVQIPVRGPDPRDDRDSGKPAPEDDPRGVEIIEFGRGGGGGGYSW